MLRVAGLWREITVRRAHRGRFEAASYPLSWGHEKNYKVAWKNGKVGEGSYGSVFLAKHLPTGKDCVVKTIKPAKADIKR